jgi:hypothetical protein
MDQFGEKDIAARKDQLEITSAGFLFLSTVTPAGEDDVIFLGDAKVFMESLSRKLKQRGGPDLVTGPDEQQRCCVVRNGSRCEQPSRFWVGTQPVDDYTYVCGDHVQDVKRAGDTVRKIK